MVYSNPNQAVEPCIKRLRQARFKADHSLRNGLSGRSGTVGCTQAAAAVLANARAMMEAEVGAKPSHEYKAGEVC